MNKTKICKKCKREFPLNDMYFFKNKQLKDGFENSCKECRGSSFIKRKEKPIAKDGFKICSNCLIQYPSTLQYFSSDKQRKDGLSYCCKKCLNARNRKNYNSECKHEYYIKNKDRILEREKEYRENNIEMFKEKERKNYIKHRDRILEYQKRYRILNKDEISLKRKLYYENNKEVCNARAKKYYKDNKEALNAKCREYYKNNKDILREKYKIYRLNPSVKQQRKINEYKRRTLKKNSLSFLTKEQWNQVLIKFNNSCAYCGNKVEKLTLDHFIPLSKGGELSISNAIPCCVSCNSSKNNRDFFEWYRKQPFYDEQREKFIINHLKYKDGVQQISIL